MKKFMFQVVPFNCWKLPFLIRVTFPSHPLVDQNPSASDDLLQLSAITRLAVDLNKPADERNLPADLFKGLEKLPSLSTETILANTLDRYFEPLGYIEDTDIQGFENNSEQAAAEDLPNVLEDVSEPSEPSEPLRPSRSC